MLRSNLEESNEANAVLRSEFSQQEDVKLYSQLPDYDDFRGYDLGIDEQLERAATLILLTFINLPGELRSIIFPRQRCRGELLRNLRFWPKAIKKDEFKQERMFGRVAKIPIANTSNELVEMDFVDYGGTQPFCASRIHFLVFGSDFPRNKET